MLVCDDELQILRGLVASTVDEPTIRVEGLEIDLVARRVRRDGQDVHLTPIEYDLLRLLARNRGPLLTPASGTASSPDAGARDQ